MFGRMYFPIVGNTSNSSNCLKTSSKKLVQFNRYLENVFQIFVVSCKYNNVSSSCLCLVVIVLINFRETIYVLRKLSKIKLV